MEKRLVNFARMLRSSGLRVSSGEVSECLRALGQFGIADRPTFYQILKATLVKAQTEEALFDLAFRLYFQTEVAPPASAAAPGPCLGGEDSVDGSGSGKAGMGSASRRLYQAVREKDGPTMLQMVKKQLSRMQIQDEEIDQLLRQIKVKMEWFMVENAFERAGSDGETDARTLQELEEYLRQGIEKKIVQVRGEDGISGLLTQEDLKNKDLGTLNEAQVKEMEKRIERLANKLAVRYSYRLKPAKSGRVDMRRMLQRAARLGRTPDNLLYQDKVRNKPALAVLCDVSGSVSGYSAFLLQLVYAMSRRFQNIRTFLFVDEVSEITPEFKLHNVQDAVREAMAAARCSRLGISNFGQVFEIFRKEYLPGLSRKTSLIILGDARNNWYLPRRDELALIAQGMEEVIWLNPEPESRWDQEDSIIGSYAPYCSNLLECRNLDQLERAVRRLV